MHLAFDLDGVLLDSERDRAWLNRALTGAVAELGLPEREAVLSAFYPPSVDGIHELAAEFEVSAETLWGVRNDHYVRVKCAAIRSGELEPFGDVETLYALVPRHGLHIISNSPTVVVETFVEACGFDDLFDVRLGRGNRLADLARRKPDPHLYRELVDRLEGEAPALYVGDSKTDRAFAAATGMRFIHLTRNDRGLDGLAALVSEVG